VDCGGATCGKDCGIGGDCLVDSDCVTGKCDTGNSQDHEETDVDGGGPMCSSLGTLSPVTKVSAADSDCRSGTCG
jgi:hypothetical protein